MEKTVETVMNMTGVKRTTRADEYRNVVDIIIITVITIKTTGYKLDGFTPQANFAVRRCLRNKEKKRLKFSSRVNI